MTTTVNIYESNIETSRNFESKIAKVINNKLAEFGKEDVSIIEINSVTMAWEGKGQYKELMQLTIDGNSYSIIKHSTDSQTYDTIGDSDLNPTTFNNFYKKFTLSLLSSKVERLAEEICENRDNANNE